MSVGRCGAAAVDSNDFSSPGSETNLDHGHRPAPNTVALIRSPRMVVKYSRMPSGTDVVATFIASDEFDHVLKLAEPDTHDEWSANGDHLRNHPHRSKVARLHGNIQNVVRQLRNNLIDPEMQSTERPRDLERALGRLLRTVGPGGPTNPRRVGPFKIDMSHRRERVNGQDLIQGSVDVSFRPSVTYDAANCQLTVNAWLIGDDNHRRESPCGLQLKRVNHRNASISDDGGSATFPVEPQRVVTCTYEVDPVKEYCLVALEASVERVD